MSKNTVRGRIRYDENFMNEGEFYVFELANGKEDEWTLETAYKLVEDRVSYEALTHIRNWQNLGIDFYFA